MHISRDSHCPELDLRPKTCQVALNSYTDSSPHPPKKRAYKVLNPGQRPGPTAKEKDPARSRGWLSSPMEDDSVFVLSTFSYQKKGVGECGRLDSFVSSEGKACCWHGLCERHAVDN